MAHLFGYDAREVRRVELFRSIFWIQFQRDVAVARSCGHRADPQQFGEITVLKENAPDMSCDWTVML
jgi:hypothetical protein